MSSYLLLCFVLLFYVRVVFETSTVDAHIFVVLGFFLAVSRLNKMLRGVLRCGFCNGEANLRNEFGERISLDSHPWNLTCNNPRYQQSLIKRFIRSFCFARESKESRKDAALENNARILYTGKTLRCNAMRCIMKRERIATFFLL